MLVEVKQFIEENKNAELAELALKLGKLAHLPKDFILNQINGFQKTAKKLPEWHLTEGILYPANQALEQASSEITAKYKALLVKGRSMADLSGGLGVDCYYLSKNFEKALYVEPEVERYEAAKHNFKVLKAKNVTTFKGSAQELLIKRLNFDLIYLDPDRRAKIGKRAFKLEDCQPNILEIQAGIFECCNQLLLKYSPMLDISGALSAIRFVKEVHIVAVENDCKEVLFLCEKNYEANIQIFCINFSKDGIEKFEFDHAEESSRSIGYSEPKKYIYEPNVSILKAGAFKSVGDEFQLLKLAANSHFYTSDQLLKNFPGRIFQLESLENAKNIKGIEANVISRNFPLKAEEIQKKYKIQDSEKHFLIATSLQDSSKVFLKCRRLK